MEQVGAWMTAFDKERKRQGAVDQSGALGLQGDPELKRIVDLAAHHYHTPFAALSIIDRRAQVLLAQRGLPVSETERESAFCAVAIHHPGEALVVPDAREDPRFADYATVLAAPFLRFYAGVPVLDGTGHALGALCVADTAPRTEPFDPALLEIMAREAERHLQ